ncbi:glycoside hydrolase family 78 protein [Streptomyces scopuliridis]|uniref:glycoside hydrolase family 78 protein n=1 Tax=Streptomyces scopuliridis TaxID=452529 RepID=UPI0036B33FE1
MLHHSDHHTRVGAPRAEHHRQPLGVGEARPRLSWEVFDVPAGWQQAGYEIESVDPDTGQAVSSGRIDSDDSVLVPWPHPDLGSRSRRQIRVRVWGAQSPEVSGWSPALALETGLLEATDWTAEFITPDSPAADESVPLLRRDFTVTGPVRRARLYATALGLYELELDGVRVGEDALAPGWTSYHHRLRYQTYDVTDVLRPGSNALGAWLADGWFRGRLGFNGGTRHIYGDQRGLLAQLEIHYADGTTDVVGTDHSWRTAPGPIQFASLYDGERYNAQREHQGWSGPGFDDSEWRPVQVMVRDKTTLVSPLGPPVRCTQEVRPVAEVTSPSGQRIVDFGQNLVGRLKVRIQGSSGAVVRLRHAEVLQDGELCVRPLRQARATDEYIVRGDGEESWEPRFTFHGFRYAEISGDIDAVFDVVARVYHTDMTRTGTFSCSDPLVQRLHDNVVWSMRGNFLDIPTDCPQRDERLGWTGDVQIFAPTASFLYDCAGMLFSWLRDLTADQLPDGCVPYFIPAISAPPLELDTLTPAAAWGDVATLTPWELYRHYGDVEMLRAQFPSAKAWVDCMTAHASDNHLWDTGFQFGDWLDPSAPPDDPTANKADPYLIATAYRAHSTAVLAEMAHTLGYSEDHQRYEGLAHAIAEAFARRWVLPSGLLENDAQSSYAIALRFGLFPTAAQRDTAGRRLAALVKEADFHIATGFVGTPVICDALTDSGHLDTAYALLLKQSCPSWLYPVIQGATTIWERWDSLIPDGTVNPGDMTSFNHYALGAVADWLHRVVAGLAPAEPGYRRLLIHPRPGGGLTHAAATKETPYGRAEVSWQRDEDTFSLDVTVPVGVTATVHLPGRAPKTVGSGRHHWHISAREGVGVSGEQGAGTGG